jgi:hypothetical protein
MIVRCRFCMKMSGIRRGLCVEHKAAFYRRDAKTIYGHLSALKEDLGELLADIDTFDAWDRDRRYHEMDLIVGKIKILNRIYSRAKYHRLR